MIRVWRQVASFCFLVNAVSSAYAATTNSWTNAVSGLWRTPANWSSNQAPYSAYTYILITNAGTKTVTIDAGTPTTNLSVQNLTISAPVGATNSLALVNVTTNLPLQVSTALLVDRGGILTLSNSAVVAALNAVLDHGGALNVTNSVVTQSSLHFFDIANGSLWLDSGLMDCSASQAVRLGRTNNTASSLTVNGGTLLASDLQIGASTGSQGILTAAGGALFVTNTFTTGFGVNSTGTVSVAGGQLIATNNIAYVGKSGYGQMTLSSGSATFAFLSVGNNMNGLLSVSGGQLIVNPRTTNDWFQIGNLGLGQLNISGGSLLLHSEFHVGDDSSGLATGSGIVSMTGGQLIATNDTTAIGRYSAGQMTISNATTWMTNVSVGRHDGAVGTMIVQSNAQMYLLDALSIGRFSNSVGHVFVTGGLISLTNDSIWVGREGSGDMTISNGIVRALGAFVALSTVVTDAVTLLPVTNVPSGSLTVSGGNMILTSNLLVGSSSISTGQVSVVGGNLSISNAAGSGYLAVSSGSFTLNQGSVWADNLLLTNTTGQFVFNGGSLQAKNATVANGSPFIVGDGVDAATLQLEGGTFVFANGLVISANSTVTGCGTIIGAITNNGTLSTNCVQPFRITGIAKAGSTATITFITVSGLTNTLEYSTNLAPANWNPIPPSFPGTGGVMTNADTNATSSTRFYRIHAR